MYKLIIIHDRNNLDSRAIQANQTSLLDQTVTTEPAYIDEIRSFVARAFNAEYADTGSMKASAQ